MTDIHLIRITDANRQKFYELFVLQPFDSAAKECTWLNSKYTIAEQNTRIDHFIKAEHANLLIASADGTLYSHDGNPPARLDPVDKLAEGYHGFIQKLRKMVSVEIIDEDKSLYVTMDQLPVGEEIAILY